MFPSACGPSPLPEETPEHRPLFPPSSDRSGTGEPFGLDEILDFRPGEDAIELRGFAGLDAFEDLAGAIAVVGGDTVIDLSGTFGGAAGPATLTVTDVIGLAAADFVFSAATG